MVLAFAVRANPKNRVTYLHPDPSDEAFLANDSPNFALPKKVSHEVLAVMQFKAVGVGAFPYLSRKLTAQDAATRILALNLLGKTGRTRKGYERLAPQEQALYSALLLRCLLESNSSMRGGAAYMMGLLRIVSAVPELIKLLNDEDRGVQEMAGRSLIRLGRKDAVPADMIERIQENILD